MILGREFSLSPMVRASFWRTEGSNLFLLAEGNLQRQQPEPAWAAFVPDKALHEYCFDWLICIVTGEPKLDFELCN